MVPQSERFDFFLLFVTGFFLFLLFFNLGNQYLWYDETENAVLARSTLRYGYPRALVDDFLVSTDETYGPGMAWIAQPWLQNYVCASSFLLLGESNTSARLFFTIFGFFSFYLIYAICLRLFRDRFIAQLALIIASTSVPFILHLRQCRYYSLAVFLTLALLISYFRFLERKKFSSFLFIATSFLLFHANFGCFVPVLATLALHFFFIEKRRPLVPEFFKLYLWVFFLVLPWCFIYKVWSQGAGGNPLGSVFRNAKFYLSKINGYFFPYRFLFVALAILCIVRKRIKILLNAEEKKALIFLVVLIMINWIFLWFADYNSARYIIHIVPIFFIIEAFIIKRIFIWKKFIGGSSIALLCFTNLLHTSLFPLILTPALPAINTTRGWANNIGIISNNFDKKILKELQKLKEKVQIRTYFFDYLYEITHDYDGPMEGVVLYLKENAKPGDTVKTHSFNANSLYFYTGLKIDIDFAKKTFPEWIFLRDYWTEDSFYDTEYFKEIEERYEKIELSYPDIRYENRPDDLSFHHFKTAPLDKKISLYKRK